MKLNNSIRNLIRVFNPGQRSNRSNRKLILDKRIFTDDLCICEDHQNLLLNNYKVSDICQSSFKTIDENELITDSTKAFLNPYETIILVMDTSDNDVVGILNIQDVIYFISKGIPIPYVQVKHIMSKEFIPLDYDATIAEIFVDVSNSMNNINPVYKDHCLHGILKKETISDLVRIEFLFDSIN